eukprot:3730720-Prymnesium_polylepis.2
MYAFPRQLVTELMRLPGVPAEADVLAAARERRPLPRIDHTAFNRSRYCALHARLVAHTEARLSADALA